MEWLDNNAYTRQQNRSGARSRFGVFAVFALAWGAFAFITGRGIYHSLQADSGIQVEGYVESASSGLLAALALHEKLLGRAPVDFTDQTAIGALGHYVSEYVGHDFQPMNVTFGIMAPAGQRFRGKMQKNLFLSERALHTVREKKTLLSPAIK